MARKKRFKTNHQLFNKSTQLHRLMLVGTGLKENQEQN